MFLLTAVRLPLFPQLLLPFPFLPPSFPSSPSLFLRYSQLDKKPLSYTPASLADDEEYLQSQLSFGLILHLVHRYLLAVFFVRNFAKMRNLKMLCDPHKGFFWKIFKKFARKVGEKVEFTRFDYLLLQVVAGF